MGKERKTASRPKNKDLAWTRISHSAGLLVVPPWPADEACLGSRAKASQKRGDNANPFTVLSRPVALCGASRACRTRAPGEKQTRDVKKPPCSPRSFFRPNPGNIPPQSSSCSLVLRLFFLSFGQAFFTGNNVIGRPCPCFKSLTKIFEISFPRYF